MIGPNEPSEELDPLISEALERVRRLGSGQASSAEIEDVKRWGAQSAEHAQALATASRLWDYLGSAGRNFLDGQNDALFADLVPRRPTVSRRLVLGGAVAAGAAAYLVIRPPLALWPSVRDLTSDYRTAAGQQRRLTIGGGVEMTLNSATSVNVRSDSGGSAHIELLDGEAAFATAPGATNHLEVVAGGGRIRASRARFDIRHDPLVRCVTCLDGEVVIERGGSAATAQAGQRVAYAKNGLAAPVPVDLVQASAWQDGLLIFHYTPLTEVVAELNRYRPGRVIVINAELGARPVNGRFRIDNIDDVLITFQKAFGARLTALPGGIVLLS